MADGVSVEREVAAPAERVWALVSDITQVGRWSPETASCEWIGGAAGPAVGTRFKGRNEIGSKRWSTVCTVTDAEPGSRFAFEVKAGPLKVARWEYRIEPAGAGCRVTETWTDQRGKLIGVLGKAKTGVDDRVAHNRAGMAETLERLADAAEAAPSDATG